MADRPNRSWARKYPPLIFLLVALLIAFLVLPSTLNLPQANPSTVLEFAPVPPSDENPPPPQTGSLSSLGLGSSSSLTTGRQPDLKLPNAGGKGTQAIAKRCVGKPLRQTEDPNAPPCVPIFNGDNGGATWQGVTKDEITVIYYAEATGVTGGDEGYEETPSGGTYCDVDSPPDTDPDCLQGAPGVKDAFHVRVARALSRYFNERFQTYGRRVHFWVYWSGAQSAAGRRADAADNWDKLKPFAVIDDASFGGFNEAYAQAMVKRRTSVFGSFTAQPAKYYQDQAPYVWGFWPDVEHWAAMYSTYLCQRVFPFQNAVHAGQGTAGKPRKYALLSSSDPAYPSLKYFADLVRQQLKSCPVAHDIVADVQFPKHQYAIDGDPDAQLVAQQNVAKMIDAGATTVLWAGGYETQTTKAAKNAKWFPEWVYAGDLLGDQIEEPRYQDQDEWAHAWVVSNTLKEDRNAEAPCRQAFREAEPQGTASDESTSCGIYSAFFQLFKSIQVAGPRLSPQTVDAGQHAIPRQASTNPYTAACFYDSGDFTCVKDAQESWWDPTPADPNGDTSARGCWRMVNGGKRYLAGEWPRGDDVFKNPNDPCNTVGDNSTNINTP